MQKKQAHLVTKRIIRQSNSQTSVARGQDADHTTHTVLFWAHLPHIPHNRCKHIDVVHSRHFRHNHVAPTKLLRMARLKKPFGLPAFLKTGIPPMHCDGCRYAHYQTAPHSRVSTRPPPRHATVTDIAGPFPATFGGHAHLITFMEIHKRMTIFQLMRTRLETEN